MSPRSPAKSSLSQQVRGYLRDPAVSLWRKASGLVAALYVVSPIDFIPDIPPIGWLDDIGVVSAVAMFLLRDIRKHASKTPVGQPVPDSPEDVAKKR